MGIHIEGARAIRVDIFRFLIQITRIWIETNAVDIEINSTSEWLVSAKRTSVVISFISPPPRSTSMDIEIKRMNVNAP